MTFVILTRVIPYVRMTRRSKFADERAQAYLASQANITWHFKEQMIQNDWIMLPARTPLAVDITFSIPQRLHCGDLDNLVKAVLDAAQGVVFKNDQWVDRIKARRGPGQQWMTVIKVGVIE